MTLFYIQLLRSKPVLITVEQYLSEIKLELMETMFSELELRILDHRTRSILVFYSTSTYEIVYLLSFFYH
jgi:hypothetical protein